MIDWPFASRLPRTIAGDPPPPPPPPPVPAPPPHRSLGAELAELTTDSEQRVRAYTGLVPSTPIPGPEAVTRKAWIDANLDGMGDLIDPLSGKLRESLAGLGPLAGPAQVAAGYVLAG